MSMSAPYPLQLEFHGDRHITRWRPLVQWLLAIPQLMIACALRSLRQVLTLISLFTVLFTERIPKPLFDMIATTYRYEWRAISYALFLHEDYPPFDFEPAAADDGARAAHDAHASPTPSISTGGSRSTNGSWPSRTTWCWPCSLVGAVFALVGGFSPCSSPVNTPRGSATSSSASYRYALRVEAYVGLLTDDYPPFRLAA